MQTGEVVLAPEQRRGRHGQRRAPRCRGTRWVHDHLPRPPGLPGLSGLPGVPGVPGPGRFRGVEGGVLPQDELVQPAQPRAGVHAEGVGEQHPPLLEGAQRVGLPVAAVQGEHERGAQALAERLGGHEGRQALGELVVPAEGQVQAGGELLGLQPLLVQPVGLGAGEAGGDVGVGGGSAPQRQGPRDGVAGRGGLGGAAGGADQPAELGGVQRPRLQHQRVPGGAGAQHAPAVRRSPRLQAAAQA